jgi:glucoamylase
MLSREQRSQERTQPRVSIPPLTLAPVPPVQQLRTPAPAWPWLYTTVLGNGHLLVCLDEAGSIAQLFYPYIDAGPHIRTFLTGIQVKEVVQTGVPELRTSETHQQTQAFDAETITGKSEDAVSWLAGEEWVHELRHIDGAAVVQCISVNTTAGVRVEQIMTVHHNQDLFMNDIKVMNLRSSPVICKFVTYAGFDIDYRRSGTTCYFNIETSMLAFFSFDRYISIICDAPVDGFGCDKSSLDELDYIFQDASTGTFNGREYAVGQVSGATSHNFGRIDPGNSAAHRMHMCFGNSLDKVVTLTSSVVRAKPDIGDTTAWWRRQYAYAQLGTGSTAVKNVYDRSLITLRLLTDSGTGGIIAAPECDPDFRSCGGYGPCWPRDGAFIGYALDSIGQYDHARAFYDWALRVQSESGVWYQRYYVNGQLAPTWGLVQFDETGAVVWAISRHVQLTGDISYGQKAFSQLNRACEYMQGALDRETGLAPITKDIWEERDGISTYACASTWAGFHELSALASMLGKSSEAERWASAAAKLKAAMETHLWDASLGRFLRGLKSRIYPQDIGRLRSEPGFSDADILETEVVGKRRYFRRRDPTVDASILGLSIPYGVFSPNDPRIMATAEAISSHLTSPVGGIRRYEHDPYRGGNPWVICALWLGLQDLAAGQKERALELYHWVLEHRTSLDLLPEQVDRTTGKPCWVVPLGWSHAMFILATQALAAQELLPQ